MSAICQTASGLAKVVRGAACLPAAARPGREPGGARAARDGAAQGAAIPRMHSAATRRQRPAGSGGPGEPPEADPALWSHWDDPALWMLMMH